MTVRLTPATPAYMIMLAACVMIAPVSTDIYLPSVPDMARIFQTDPALVQLTLGSFLFGFAGGNLIQGPLADRFGRRPIILVGLGVFVTASVLCLLAEEITTIVVLRFFQALGGSGAIVVSRAVVRDVYPIERAAVTLSAIGMINGGAPILAPIAGGVLHAFYGWQGPFVAMAVFGTVLMVAIAVLFAETLDPKHRQPIRPRSILGNYAALLRSPIFVGYTAVNASGFFGLFAYLSAIPFIFRDVHGMSAETFGIVFGVITGGYLTGSIISMRIAAQVGGPRMLSAGIALILAGGLSMAALALLGVTSPLAIAVPQTIYLVGIGITVPQGLAGAMRPFPHMAGTASSLLGFIQMGGAGLFGALVVSFLPEEATPAAHLPLALAVALSALMAAAARLLARWAEARAALQPASG